MRFQPRKIVIALSLMVVAAGIVYAAVSTIPNSALIPSTTYYTDTIGGGIGSSVMARNDDDFAGPLDLGFTLNFFGTDYTQYYANNNGNISFGEGISDFTPDGPQGAPQPIISPFFADVDTRNPASGLVYTRTDIPNELIVTWDQVGYFEEHADKLDSFQLVVRGPNFTVPSGEGRIGFWYKTMQWETGDASEGVDGFGGTPAAVGFGDGAGNGSVLQGSIQDGISGVVSNHHIWFDLSGGVPTVTGVPTTPAPTSITLIFLGLAGLAGSQFLRSRKQQA